ncbi:MAG TPA: acetylornithine/succinylornithine family transaminase [Vicinamibacterales bacterium]|nr:acetylornithine/succinylornithine family transaminase [Vicinamibacterales bacterium]
MSTVAVGTDRLLGVYRRPEVVFERGTGAWLFDATGRAYLDFISGVGVASLGHAHPRLAQAIGEQAGILSHTSNLFQHPFQAPVAERLTALAGLDRAFLCNSGTEAVEACLKFARRYWHAQHEARPHFVALEHAFHGRTMGALSVTWDAHYRDPFAPLVGPVTFVPPGDPTALDAAVTRETAAVIVEPIQGEGGVRPLSPAFAASLKEACARTGALLIADEVQCGLGRTGVPFVSTTLGLEPDMLAVGKALGAGFPIAAALFSARVAAAAQPGDHGSTYGGNLLACRAALVFLEELMDRGLLAHVRAAGAVLEQGLRALAARVPQIKDVRGAGLMWGLEIEGDALALVDAARERGLLINRTSATVLRLLPPFIVAEGEIAQGLEWLEESLAQGGRS